MEEKKVKDFHCDKCFKGYITQKSLDNHRCKGVGSLQCIKCLAFFKSKQDKYRHKIENNCCDIGNVEHGGRTDPLPSVVNSPINNGAVTNINSNINTNNGTVINGTVININLAVPKDFRDTDLQLVIDAIVRNPAFMQLAHEHNLLTEAILDETHFSGALENRNVFGADKKGKYLNVMVNGQRGVINKKVGLAQSINNVNTIANSPKVRTFLTDEDDDKPILPTPDSAMMERCLKNKHEEIMYMKGSYRIPASMTVPTTVPVYFTQTEIEDLMLQSLELVLETPYRQDINVFKDLAMKICGNFKCVNGKWFKGIGEGWEVYKDTAKLQKEVHLVLNDLKNKFKDNLTKNKGLFSNPAKAEKALDYFPDRVISRQAVEWLQEELSMTVPPLS